MMTVSLRLSQVAVLLLLGCVLVSAGSSVVPNGSKRVDMRVLLVSGGANLNTDPEVGAARTMFDAQGVPFDHWVCSTANTNITGLETGPFLPMLLDPADSNHALYQAVFVSQYRLACISWEDWVQFEEIARRFAIRVVYMFTTPQPGVGVTAPGTMLTSQFNMRLNANVASYATGYNMNMNLNVTGVNWYNGVTIVDGELRSLADFYDNAGTFQGVALAEAVRSTGLSDMYSFASHAFWSFHSRIMTSIMLNWATRNMYCGSRRIHLSTQLDDLFLSTQTWNVAREQAGDIPGQETIAYRCTPDDLQHLHDYSEMLNTQLLPPGSNYRAEWPINGKGVSENGGFDGDQLYLKCLTMIPKFFWESHTWSHLDLTNNDQVVTPHATTYDETFSEMSLNVDFLRRMFATTADQEFLSMKSMVTPKISGLFNGNALSAIKANGVDNVVGDNTVVALAPKDTWYHGFYTTVAEHGFDGVFVIPRFATNVYYDCSTATELESEYNHIYRTYWGQNVTINFIMQQEAARVVPDLLAFRHDPHMFHQGNTRVFSSADPVSGEVVNHSLLTMWLRVVVNELNKYSTMPVHTFKHDVIVEQMKARMQRDACGCNVTLVLNATNDAIGITVAGGNGCTMGLTGVPLVEQTDVTLELYGNTPTTAWVHIPALSAERYIPFGPLPSPTPTPTPSPTPSAEPSPTPSATPTPTPTRDNSPRESGTFTLTSCVRIDAQTGRMSSTCDAAEFASSYSVTVTETAVTVTALDNDMPSRLFGVLTGEIGSTVAVTVRDANYYCYATFMPTNGIAGRAYSLECHPVSDDSTTFFRFTIRDWQQQTPDAPVQNDVALRASCGCDSSFTCPVTNSQTATVTFNGRHVSIATTGGFAATALVTGTRAHGKVFDGVITAPPAVSGLALNGDWNSTSASVRVHMEFSGSCSLELSHEVIVRSSAPGAGLWPALLAIILVCGATMLYWM